MMKKHMEEALEAVDEQLCSDAAAESDMVLLDEMQGTPVGARELMLANVVSNIYSIVHPLFCKACGEKRTREIVEGKI